MFAIAPYLKEIAFHKTETGVVGAIIFFTTMAPLANLHFAATVAKRHDTHRKKIWVNRTHHATTAAYQLPFGFTTFNCFRSFIMTTRVLFVNGRDNFATT